LLKIELVRSIISYIKEEYPEKSIDYTMTTNATLITDDILSFASESGINLVISLDGPKDIHDMNRRYAVNDSGTYYDVMNNVKRIIDWNNSGKTSISFSINMVIDPQYPISKVKELYLDYPELFDVSVRATIVDTLFSLKEPEYSKEYIADNTYESFLALLDHLEIVSGLSILPFVKSALLESFSKIQRTKKDRRFTLPDSLAPSGPCIAGCARLFVDVNGVMFPCERVSETSEVMKIGTIYDGFDIKKCSAIINYCQISEETCKECWAFVRCGLCARAVDDGDKFSKDFLIPHCKQTKQYVESLLQLELLLEEVRLYRQEGIIT